jgi:hypothetical protein
MESRLWQGENGSIKGTKVNDGGSGFSLCCPANLIHLDLLVFGSQVIFAGLLQQQTGSALGQVSGHYEQSRCTLSRPSDRHRCCGPGEGFRASRADSSIRGWQQRALVIPVQGE